MSSRYAPPHGTAPGLAPFAEALALPDLRRRLAEVLSSPDFQRRLDEAMRAALRNGVTVRPLPLIQTGRLSGMGSR